MNLRVGSARARNTLSSATQLSMGATLVAAGGQSTRVFRLVRQLLKYCAEDLSNFDTRFPHSSAVTEVSPQDTSAAPTRVSRIVRQLPKYPSRHRSSVNTCFPHSSAVTELSLRTPPQPPRADCTCHCARSASSPAPGPTLGPGLGLGPGLWLALHGSAFRNCAATKSTKARTLAGMKRALG
jgi:hypothetical protein